MTALIVGGDRIDAIKKAMAERGMECIDHWSGRKTGDLRKKVPKGTELIVVLYDRLSHNMLKNVSSHAAGTGIPIIHCTRSKGQLCRKLDEMNLAGSLKINGGIAQRECYGCSDRGRE